MFSKQRVCLATRIFLSKHFIRNAQQRIVYGAYRYNTCRISSGPGRDGNGLATGLGIVDKSEKYT